MPDKSISRELATSAMVGLPRPAVDTDFWNKAGLPVSNLPASAVMKPQHLVEAALKGLDRDELWVFPSLPEQGIWDDHQKTRQTLVGGLMNGALAARYAA
jgi:short-subunit dehydrogenase